MPEALRGWRPGWGGGCGSAICGGQVTPESLARIGRHEQTEPTRTRTSARPADRLTLAFGSGAADDDRYVDHDGAPGKIRYLRRVTPGASMARTCPSRTSASPRLSRRREP